MDVSVFREIGIVNNLIRQYINEQGILFQNGEDISKVEGFVINFICHNHDKNIYQKDIEKVLMVRKSTVTELLNKMEAKGMIERHTVAIDKRLKKIVPTKQALERYVEVKDRLSKMEESVVKGLSQEEINTFIEIINKIKSNLTSKGELKW